MVLAIVTILALLVIANDTVAEVFSKFVLFVVGASALVLCAAALVLPYLIFFAAIA